MKEQAPATAAELQDIQDKWMALSPSDPQEKIREVIKLMGGRYPQRYLSTDEDQTVAQLIWDGIPMWSQPRPIFEALAYMRQMPPDKCRMDVVWCRTHWTELKHPKPHNPTK